MLDRILGPLLILDDIANGRMHLAAIFVAPPGQSPGPVSTTDETVAPTELLHYDSAILYRARFSVPADAPSSYSWNGETYALASDLTGDLRLAYASCNGEEHGDMDRDEEERNVMWAHLADEHRRAPFALLLHGGDQVYADEATHGHPLSEDWPDKIPRDPLPHDIDDLRAHLRERFAERYIAQLKHPNYAWLVARVPALAQWDDHDICDGWGSLPRSRTYSPVGQCLFEVAKEATLAFQHGTIAGDLPARFDDPEGYHLGWQVSAPGLRLLGPDLRGERTRRQVMDDGGWRAVEAQAAVDFTGHTFVMSSVPLLGPRLSILEALMVLTPKMQKYEDDLRDQWQSRAHRDSWRRMLTLMMQMQEMDGQDVTILSGEIHLATRAEMAARNGQPLHQLVASGITHRPPPKAWARFLGALSRLGESPLQGHPIRIRRIPGQSLRYVADRNALVLERRGAEWHAVWHFETHGPSPALAI
ncbi:alkaline phosphatase D family protein [Gymnodinialimonas hymeniacidonis]|uniref:alkaline phosphatase D family protein n=1 Tax=Gymnodinialimonas hymeniacidonis TaxID=3126508 RepID=UPI0034C600A7